MSLLHNGFNPLWSKLTGRFSNPILMNQPALLVLLFVSTLAVAQETRLRRFDISPTPSRSETEEVDVLKANRNVRHGTYRRLRRDKTAETGFYRNNQRDSLWTTFYFRSGEVKSRGMYRNDRKTGVWEYFDGKGQPMAQFDFSAGRRVDAPVTRTDSSLVRLVTGRDTLMVRPEYPAMFAGGKEGYADFLIYSLIYPPEAQRSGQSGRVRVGFWIDEEGRVSDVRPLTVGNEALVKEANRLVGLSDRQWIPAQYGGRAMRSYFTMPVLFENQGIINTR